MSTNQKQQKSEQDKEKQRLMSGADLNQEKQELEENKRTIGTCVSDFTIVKELGRGSYGVVYKAISNINKKEYVMKKINIKHMDNKHQKEALKEAQILRKVRHENIIRFYTSFVEHENLYIIMEYADGGDLQQLLRYRREKKKQFTESEVWEFAQDLIKAVDYLHKNNIIHRDIKTLNIFLTKDRKVKLGDLGVSKIVSSQAALQGTRVGTPLYLAPELVKQQPYDFKVDIWAIGIVLYHISALEPPFQGENLIALGFNIVHKFPKPLPSLYSPKLVSFINKLLEKNPLSRPKTSELIEGFQKKNERPMTGQPQSSNGRTSSQQNINDKIEVFDKGNYNILNKIIEEDQDMAAAFEHKFDNKRKSIEINKNESRPSSALPYNMRRPQTCVGRDREKNQISQKIQENINNDYNNINILQYRSNNIEFLSDNKNSIDDDVNGFRNQIQNKQQVGSQDDLSSSSNNNQININNNNKQNALNSNNNSSPMNSNVNRNFSKNKEVMTYNKKKMSLITDSNTTAEEKKKNINQSAPQSVNLQSGNITKTDEKRLSQHNQDEKRVKLEQQQQIVLSQQLPLHKVGAQSQQMPNSNSQPYIENPLHSHRILTQAQDKDKKDKNSQLRLTQSQVQTKQQIKNKQEDNLKQVDNKKKFQSTFDDDTTSAQRQSRDNIPSQKQQTKENVQGNINNKDFKTQPDKKQKEFQEKQKSLSQASNLKDTNETKDIKEYLKETQSKNNTNTNTNINTNAAKNEIKPQNPLVAYFNIGKSMSENLQNNFKIRPFSAQTKPRQSDQMKKIDINNFVKNDEIGQLNSNNQDAFKLEQIIKEFKQEAQKIREAPLNIYANGGSNSQPTITPKDNKIQQSNKKNEKPNISQSQNQGVVQSAKKDNQNNQGQSANKNTQLNEKQKKEDIFSGNENIVRPQSAHPLVGSRQNKVFNQFNNRYVSGVSANQIIAGFNSPFQTNSNTSHKSIVNNFIKNSIGKMNNNVIIDPANKPQQKDSNQENDKNYFFYRIDNVQRDVDEINPSSTKSSLQKMDISSKIKPATSTNFYKDSQMTSSVKGSNSINIENPQQKEKQASGKVLLLNNTRPQSSTGIKKKYTIKDLVSEQLVYLSNQVVSQ